MKRRKEYKDQDRFRRYRNAYKQRYADKRNFSDRKGKRWTQQEIEIVLAHEMTDTEIAKMLKRSILSIQTKRCKVKKVGGNDA